MKAPPWVYLVDDNQPFRRSTALLLETSGIAVRDFEGARALLAELEQHQRAGGALCTVSDVRMPDMSGLELLEELKRRQLNIPVILISAHADVPLAVEAMRRGAANFIEKPFAPEALIQAIRLAALEEATTPTLATAEPAAARVNPRLASLTRRERQVLELVVAGKFNKTIAEALGISTKTVELHRASVMGKLGVRTLPDLVKVFLGYEATPALRADDELHSENKSGNQVPGAKPSGFP
jgi:two-component system, LuxR family, response regulator FixJ